MAGSSERYSADGRWRWNGARWEAVSPSERPASGVVLGLNVGALAAVIAGTMVITLVVAGLAGLLLVTRVQALQALVPASLPGVGAPASLSAFTSRLEASSFECSQGYSSPVGVWFCFQTRLHDYTDVGIQVRGQDGLGLVSVEVARNANDDPDPGGYARGLFEQIAGAVVDGLRARLAKSWVGSNLTSSGGASRTFGTTRIDVQEGADSNQQAAYQLDAWLGNTRKQSIDAPSLRGVSEPAIQHYFEGRGWTCQTEAGAGRVNCSGSSSDADYSGTIYTGSDGQSVRFFYAGLSPHTGDVTSAARDLFAGSVRLALRGSDAARTISWVNARLNGRSHDLVVNGVHVGLYPAQEGTSLRQGGELEVWLGAWSW